MANQVRSDDQPILVLNSGSRSLKIGLFRHVEGEEQLLVEGGAEEIGPDLGRVHLKAADGTSLLDEQQTLSSPAEALQVLASAMNKQLHTSPAAVGHRVVHGGPHLRQHQKVTPEVLQQLEAAVHFAPLHIPDALRLIHEAERWFPACPQFACFDTAFHCTMPPRASHLPLPARFFDMGVMRYGFHGLSCESVMHRLGVAAPAKIVIAHLGGGSSITAVHEGTSIDTSMGLSPAGGVPMSTRSGDLDPGVLLYLLREQHLTLDQLESFINHECGMAGFANGEGDMLALMQRAKQGDAGAILAVDVFTTDIRKAIGSYIALMGGLDLLVFTGGIGQHSAEVRGKVLAGLESFGITETEAVSSKVKVLAAEEEVQIARHCRAMLASPTPPST